MAAAVPATRPTLSDDMCSCVRSAGKGDRVILHFKNQGRVLGLVDVLVGRARACRDGASLPSPAAAAC